MTTHFKGVKAMHKPISVLMVLPNLRPSNGVTNFVMNYFEELDHDDIRMDFATLSYRESPYIEEVEKAGSCVFVLPSLIKHPFMHIRKCHEIITSGDYDIIHDNTLIQSIPIMHAARKKVKVRLIHSHSTKLGESGLKERINRTFMPLLLDTVTHRSACSINAGRAMFGKKPFTVIPNVIDVSRYVNDNKTREVVRRRENVEGKMVIGSVGRLAEPKNPYFSFKVIEEVLKSRENIEYWWIGSGPLDDDSAKYLKERNLTGKIRLFGSRSDVAELYQAMDLFFLPSIFEGFGLACIEAQAIGLPCVVSSAFPSEVDVTGNVCFLPLDVDIDTWVAAIKCALDKPCDRIAANDFCRKSIYSTERSGSLLADTYRVFLG